MPDLTIERLREVLTYAPETGLFYWRVARRNHVKVGDVAGVINRTGYRRICIDGKRYLASRLAWAWMTGEWPIEVDHRDTDCANDTWGNLRQATHSQNQANRRRPSNNTSGFKGVFRDRRSSKWRARIVVNRKRKDLGSHVTREAAHAAYRAAAVDHYGDFARFQ
jgi:HNH endonuclease/AP2 domain